MIKKSKKSTKNNTVKAFANCTSCSCAGYRCYDDTAYKNNQFQKISKSNYLKGIGYMN